MSEHHLHDFFHPESVAIVGASEHPGKIGHSVVDNLLRAGFRGSVHPVNPRSTEILGLPVTRRIGDLPRNLDMAVITIPRDHVLDTLKELAGIGTRSAIIITAGFKEVGREGYYREQELIRVAQDHGMALLGPNCLGVINTDAGVNLTFASGTPSRGNVAFFSQSGALCQAILDWAMGENMGFSKFISLGNKAILNEAHMLDYLGQDPETNVVLGYIENVSNGVQFVEAAQRMSKRKPVLMIKSGTSAAGAKAASSHTGAIAGSDQAYEAAFEKSGIIRVRDVSTLFTLAQAFSNQPLPGGPNLAIVTNSGGPGIMTADACEQSHIQIAELAESTVERLRQFLPSFASLYNPVDIIGDADAERYRRTTEEVVQDGNVDAVLVLLTPTATIVSEMEETARGIIEASRKANKPVFACLMGKQAIGPGQRMLQEAGIPCYNFPEPAIQSLDSMYRYKTWREKTHKRPEQIAADHKRVSELIQASLQKRIGSEAVEIVEYQAQEIFKAYDLPMPRSGVAHTSKEAVDLAEQIGYPVVLKIASVDISHKSDVDGVRIALGSAGEVEKAFMDITSRARRLRPQALITGCLVQEMAPKGAKEIIVGFTRDEQFGPLLMFGMGGIYVEVLRDISFKLAPVTRTEAAEMIRGIRSSMLLRGVRGEAPVNIQAIEDVILRISQLAVDYPRIAEAECNPVLVDQERAVVADARMTVS
jgi:acetyltransferase